MDRMPRSKDRSRSEMEKLREMSFKEKLEYIWAYYSYYIVGGILGIVMLVSVLSTCLNREEAGLYVEWGAGFIEYEDFSNLNKTIEARLFAESGEVVQGSINYMTADDPSMVYSYFERTMAMLAANSIDIFILDADLLEEYSAIEFLLPLEDTLNVLKMQDFPAYERLMDEAVYMQYGYNEDGTPTPELITGIRITESPLLRELSIPVYSETYACIAISTGNYENAVQALTLFFG